MTQLLVLLAAVYGLILSTLFLLQRKLMYLPDRERPARPLYGADGAEEVALRTIDGLDLLAWFWPAGTGQGTILFLHGNAGHIGWRVEKARPYLAAGYGMLLVEWRGFGGNPGAPTEEGLMADARAAVAFLETRAVRGRDLLIYGESIGTGPATRLAAELALSDDPAGALVLEAPFTSAAAVAQLRYPWLPAYWLVRDRHDVLSRIGRIAAPLLVLHGAKDRVMPARMGRAVHAAAAEPKRLLLSPAAGHNDLYEHGAADAALTFLATL